MKLRNPVGRSTEEWIGKTADTWPPPEAVQLRVLLRQDGKCAITGHRFAPGDKKRLDHIIPLADGGKNRESNLQWLLDDEAHKPKTKREAGERAKVRARAKSHAGIKTPPKRPIPQRARPPGKETKLPAPGQSEIYRRYNQGKPKP